MVFTFAACGGGSGSGSGDGGGEAEGGVKYGVILKTAATPFWITMADGVNAYAEENGLTVDLQTAKSDDDTEGQLNILESMINSGEYAGIAIAPCSGVNMISGVKKANDAGIVIVNVDEQFDPAEMESQGATCVAYVASDNVAVGKSGAAYLCTLLEPGSEVAIIEGIAGNVSSEDRKNGATEAFNEAGMTIIGSQACDWDMQKAMDTAATWITQYPNLKAIYCCNDGMAQGVMTAIANAGKTGEILLCGTDGDDYAIQGVKDGGFTATVAQDSASIGATSLQLLVDAVNNPDKYTASASPEKTPVEAIVVTAENVDQFL